MRGSEADRAHEARKHRRGSLMQVFGRGHLVTRNGATVYVTWCQAAEVLPRTHTNCTNEILAILNGTNVFVNPISFVIKAAAAPVRCNDVAPPRWRLNGRWYCAFPAPPPLSTHALPMLNLCDFQRPRPKARMASI